MAQNIDSILDFISKDVLVECDLSSIKGSQIVEGNMEQVAMLLQVLYEISKLIQEKAGSKSGSNIDQNSENKSGSLHSLQDKLSNHSLKDYSIQNSEKGKKVVREKFVPFDNIEKKNKSDKSKKQEKEEKSNILDKSWSSKEQEDHPSAEEEKSSHSKKSNPYNVNQKESKVNRKDREIKVAQIDNNPKSEEFYTLRDILRNKRIPFSTMSEKRKIIDRYFSNCDSAPSGSNENSEFEYLKEDSGLINRAESETQLKWTDIFGTSREGSSQEQSIKDKSLSKEESNRIVRKSKKGEVLINNNPSDYNQEENNIS